MIVIYDRGSSSRHRRFSTAEVVARARLVTHLERAFADCSASISIYFVVAVVAVAVVMVAVVVKFD